MVQQLHTYVLVTLTSKSLQEKVMGRAMELYRVVLSFHRYHLMQALMLHTKVLRHLSLEYQQLNLRQRFQESIRLRLFLQMDLLLEHLDV